MKKAIFIILALGMAATANAELVLTLIGPNSLLTGQIGTYTVGFYGAEIISADVDVVRTAGIFNAAWIIPPNEGDIYPWDGNFEVVIINDVLATNLSSPLFGFYYTAPNYAGTQTISVLENAFFDLNWEAISGTMPSMDIKVIPEPATIALLGLGGLLLRRRK